jgi:hypothetical protein
MRERQNAIESHKKRVLVFVLPFKDMFTVRNSIIIEVVEALCDKPEGRGFENQ